MNVTIAGVLYRSTHADTPTIASATCRLARHPAASGMPCNQEKRAYCLTLSLPRYAFPMHQVSTEAGGAHAGVSRKRRQCAGDTTSPGLRTSFRSCSPWCVHLRKLSGRVFQYTNTRMVGSAAEGIGVAGIVCWLHPFGCFSTPCFQTTTALDDDVSACHQ